MTTMLQPLGDLPGDDLNSRVAGEIRAVCALRRISHRALARRMEHPQLWVARRIGNVQNRGVPISLPEVEEFATALGVPVSRLLGGGGEGGGVRREGIEPPTR